MAIKESTKTLIYCEHIPNLAIIGITALALYFGVWREYMLKDNPTAQALFFTIILIFLGQRSDAFFTTVGKMKHEEIHEDAVTGFQKQLSADLHRVERALLEDSKIGGHPWLKK